MDSELRRVFAIGSHRGTCVTVKCSNDLDELLWDAVSMLEDVPQSISIYRVVGLPEINTGHVQGASKFRDFSIEVLRAKIWYAQPRPQWNPHWNSHWLLLSWHSTTCSMWIRMALPMTLLAALSEEIP